jgi:hypothetical protein
MVCYCECLTAHVGHRRSARGMSASGQSEVAAAAPMYAAAMYDNVPASFRYHRCSTVCCQDVVEDQQAIAPTIHGCSTLKHLDMAAVDATISPLLLTLASCMAVHRYKYSGCVPLHRLKCDDKMPSSQRYECEHANICANINHQPGSWAQCL